MAILSFSIINFKPCIPKKYIPGHCNETRECNWINGALFMCDDGDFCSPVTLLEPLYFTSTPQRCQAHFDLCRAESLLNHPCFLRASFPSR